MKERIFTSSAGAGAKYCNEYVCVSCLSVCLSVCRKDISKLLSPNVCPQRYLRNHTRDLLFHFFIHVVYVRGSARFQLRCDTLCTSGFVDDIMFFYYNGSDRGMNFRTNDPFCLHLLIYLP